MAVVGCSGSGRTTLAATPSPRVMARTIRRALRTAFTRAELRNGNKEPLSNLWSAEVDGFVERVTAVVTEEE